LVGEVNVEGGEGGIREVEKEYEGIFIHAFEERGTWSFGESWFTVGFTVHRG
jgi:hypothetical protein